MQDQLQRGSQWVTSPLSVVALVVPQQCEKSLRRALNFGSKLYLRLCRLSRRVAGPLVAYRVMTRSMYKRHFAKGAEVPASTRCR